MLKIIGEMHDESNDELFVQKSKKLAKDGHIILVLENEIFDNCKNGFISKNVYGIEDKIITEYTGVIIALSEIHPNLRKYENYDNKNFLTILAEMSEENPQYSSIQKSVHKDFDKYIKSYVHFLGNTKEGNPVSKILRTVLKQYDESPLRTIFTSIYNSSEEINPSDYRDDFYKNIDFFNNVLCSASLQFRKYIINGEYSNEIKNHKGISEEWIKEYFKFKHISTIGSGNILNHDEVVISLRNQLFYERLNKLLQDNQNKEIWFIVGEAHLPQLEELFRSNNANKQIKIINREDKENVLKEICSNTSISTTQPLLFSEREKACLRREDESTQECKQENQQSKHLPSPS